MVNQFIRKRQCVWDHTDHGGGRKMPFYKNKKFWIIAGIVAAVCGAGVWITRNVTIHKNGVSVTIIGGADGPTSVFLAGKLPGGATDEGDAEAAADAESGITAEAGTDDTEDSSMAAASAGIISMEDNISTMPLEMTMKAVKFENGILTLEIDNHSGYEMTYGEDYELQRQEGDSFVKVEPESDIVWHDIAYSIPDLTKVTVTCNLNPYGKLQAGVYKLIKSDMEAVFELTEDYDPE